MLQINNKNLCEKCFLPLQSNKTTCKHCFSGKNTDKYPTALPEGTILSGRYIVGKVLGKGGFGITYLCYDSKQDKRVAIKEYLPDALTHRNTGETQVSAYDGEKKDYFLKGAKKFFEEAKLVSRFNGNPNIIGVYEFFYENNTAYFVMEYLDGTDFKTYITENGGKLNENQVAFAADKMCDALIIVHSMGVLHRDISPDNIFICENGNIKLIDFGAARQVLGEASKSLSVILKQGFAPLEQYQKHGNQGPWTDIYALGASLYYALTGKVIDDAMTRLSDDTLELNGISPEFAAVIKKMLAIKTEDRYQSAVELKQAINSTGISFEPIIIQPEEQEPKPDPDPDPDPDPEPDPDPNPVPRDEKSFVNDLVDKLRSSKKILIPTLSVLLVCVIAAVVVVIVNGHKKAPVSESIPVVDENIANTPSMSVVENTIIATEETTLEHTEGTTSQHAGEIISEKYEIDCWIDCVSGISTPRSEVNPYGFVICHYKLSHPYEKSAKLRIVSEGFYKSGEKTTLGDNVVTVDDISIEQITGGDINKPNGFDGGKIKFTFYDNVTGDLIGSVSASLSNAVSYYAKTTSDATFTYEENGGMFVTRITVPAETKLQISSVSDKNAYLTYNGHYGYIPLSDLKAIFQLQ